MSVLKRYTGTAWEAVGGAEAPPIRLGYAQVTADQTGIGTSPTDLTGLSVTVSVAAGRTIRITGQCIVQKTGADGIAFLRIYEGATMLNTDLANFVNGQFGGLHVDTILTPTAGSHTYKLTGHASAGTLSTDADATYPAFILVEDITGGSGSPSGADVWTDFTPTWTNLVVGNGVVVARYSRSGNTVKYRVSLVLGSTTTMTASSPISLSLPAAAHASGYQANAAYYLDNTVRHWVGVGLISPGGTTVALKHTESTGAGDVSTVGPGSFWGSGDIMVVSGIYEAA